MQPCPRLVKVDLLDYLFTNVGIYNQLDVQGKSKILNSRPQPGLDVVLDVVGDKKFVCPFRTQYYTEFPWMTACPKRNVLFCFVCLLQGKTVASVICTKDDIVKAALAHETTVSHMSSHDACLRSVVDAKQNNETTRRIAQKRRSIVVKLLQTSFLVKCSSYFDRIGKRREFHRRTLDFLSTRDVNLPVDWRELVEGEIDARRETTIFEIIKSTVVDRIKRELSTTDYVSLQIEDVSELTTKPTVSATFRFIVDDQPIHRFAGFYQIDSPFSTIDDSFIRDIAKLWNVQNKLTAVSGDFHSDRLPIRVDSGRLPHWRRLSSIYHKSNYLFVKIATEYEEIRRFVGQIQIIANFVKRVVDNVEGEIPEDLKNVELSTIDEQITVIFNNLKFLKGISKRNKVSYADSMIAEDVEKILTNDHFLSFGAFFGKLFEIGPTADECFGCYVDETISEKRSAITTAVTSFTNDDGSVKRRKTQVSAVIGQITVDILNDVDARCEMNRRNDLCRFFYQNSRRRSDVEEMIRLATEGASNVVPKLSNRLATRLRTELQTILRDSSKRLSPPDLFEQMNSAGSTTTVFPAFARILKYFLTLPIHKLEIRNDEMSTYERIKILARLSEFRDFDFPIIEYDLTLTMLADQATLEEMIDRLSEDQNFSTLLA